MENKNTGPDQGRRKFCHICIGGLSAITAGTVAFPVVSFLGLPKRYGSDKPFEVSLNELAAGQALYADFQGQQIIVLFLAEGARVFSASCPHLGCNVSWDSAEVVFRCPCHGAFFDSSGKVISGPVSAPLKEIPFEIKDEKIVIT